MTDKLWRFIHNRVAEKDDAWDIYQETLIAANESLPQFKNQSAFFTWLCGIAKHEISDYYRKKKIKTLFFSRLPWLENLVSQALGPEQILLKKEFEQQMFSSLKSLSEGYQLVLRLKYYQGLTVKEIAQKLNENVKTIESRLTRARVALAKVFTADFY